MNPLWWLLAVPLALACDHVLEPETRKRWRDRARLRRVRALPPKRPPLSAEMREHWTGVLTTALAHHRYWCGKDKLSSAAHVWTLVERARAELGE